MNHQDLAAKVSQFLASGYEDFNPSREKRTPDESHELDESGRCGRCGMQASWCGIESRCMGADPTAEGIAPADAQDAFAAFIAWWHYDRPLTVEEWAAEFVEYLRTRK